MKRHVLFGAAFILAVSLLAADAKDEVTSAAKKLADASAYGWKATTEVGGGGGGGRMQPGPTEGLALKDGTICVKMTRGENTTEAFVKGEKAVIKTESGWQTPEEMANASGDQQGNRGRWIGRMVQNYRAPAKEVAEMVTKVKELKKDGDAYMGELTSEGVASLLTFGRQGGGNAPATQNAKGNVKIWLKDGVVAKYEYQVQATMEFQGNERTIDRTTTVEIKNVGSAKIEVPEEAKKKLS